jgi:hypothetical protein
MLQGVEARRGVDLERANLRNPSGDAIFADALDCPSDLFLRGAKVKGGVRLLGAAIGGDLSCRGAELSAPGGVAFDLSRARVSGSLNLSGGMVVEGDLRLSGCSVGILDDDGSGWPRGGRLALEGCDYGAFARGNRVDFATRRRWLDLGRTPGHEATFSPQPHVQFARVLRVIGHEGDARRVLARKEALQRAARRSALRARIYGEALRLWFELAPGMLRRGMLRRVRARHRGLPPGDVRRGMIDGRLRQARFFKARPARRPTPSERSASLPAALAVAPGLALMSAQLGARTLWDRMLGAVIGYGHFAPRAFVYMIPFVLSGWGVFGWAQSISAMQPAQAVWLRGAEWTGCANAPDRLDCFELAARDYPHFSPFAYSVDVIFPVVDVGQTQYWAPAVGMDEGKVVQAWQRVQRFFGWALSLLAIAGFSGIVKKD